MSTPTRGQVHIDGPLTNISTAYIQSASAFVAADVFPIIPVQKQSDKYFKYDRAEFNRDEMRKRAPGTESAGGGYTLSTDSYFCDVYAFHKDIDDQIRANFDSPLNANSEATEYLSQKYLISRERNWATAAFAQSKWGTDVEGVASNPSGAQVVQWDAFSSSDPINNIKTYKTSVLSKTGFVPNTLTMGQQVWDALTEHPDILDRIKYSSGNSNPAIVTRQAVAALFEVDQINVAQSIYNSAAEGATESEGFIIGKGALLTYRPPRPGLMTPSAGYTFVWSGLLGANAYGSRMKSFRMEHLESDRIEIEAAYVHKIVATDLGVFFRTLVA